jgi:hypothetical protein
MALKRFFQSAGAKDHKTYTLQLNAVRLADTALSEYGSGREAILEYHAKRRGIGITFILRASGHFEACVWALERFVKHTKTLRGAPFAPADLRRLVPRNLRFLQSSAEKQIVGLRHTLAHLEQKAFQGKLPQGSTILLLAVGDGLCVGDHLVTWQDLAAWLQDVHKCASDLADYMGDQGGDPVVTA